MFIPDLYEFLGELARNRFYGMIEIRYEAGHVATVRKIESLKVAGDEPSRFRGVPNDHSTR